MQIRAGLAALGWASERFAALTSPRVPATVAAMDTIKLLLTATVALLVGALVMSWQSMTQGVKNAPADEVARLKVQIDEIRKEQDKLQIEKQLQMLKTTPDPSSPSNPASDLAQMKADLEANKATVAKLQEEKDKAARDAKVAQDEAGLLGQKELEEADNELRRARMISEALLIGKVTEYVEDAQFGGFITFSIALPDQVQVGTVLAIRRKTGILAQFKVSEVTAEGGIANPLPGFGPVQVKVGDELILPPQY